MQRKQKKLIAIAVAGVFGAPALALAQASTVQIYGRAYLEYGYAKQGTNRPNTDILQSPTGSAIGFRGEEKLGGGLSVWFQCESSADLRGLNQDGFCGRNSAAGLKGDWGNAHIGKWDTPFKRAVLTALPSGLSGALDITGLLGSAFLLTGTSTGTGALGTGPAGTGTSPGQSLQRIVWQRRETGNIYYESPVFSGFQVLASYSPANATASLNTSTMAKPRVQSVAALYLNGPLVLTAAYERHNEFSSVGGAGDDRGWQIGGAYTFAGVVRLGATYLDYDYEMSPTTNLKKKNWAVGVSWKVSGPHTLQASYVSAGDSKGNATTNTGVGTGNGAIAVPGPDTGATQWGVAYRYDFSKRTYTKFGYVKLNNDSKALYSLGGLATVTGAAVGTSQSAWAATFSHTF